MYRNFDLKSNLTLKLKNIPKKQTCPDKKQRGYCRISGGKQKQIPTFVE